MAARLKGNNPFCSNCYFFREKEDGEKNICNGWCLQKKAFETYSDGRKRETVPDKFPTNSYFGGGCKHWEDAQTRQTRYEALTEWQDKEEQLNLFEMLEDMKQ